MNRHWLRRAWLWAAFTAAAPVHAREDAASDTTVADSSPSPPTASSPPAAPTQAGAGRQSASASNTTPRPATVASPPPAKDVSPKDLEHAKRSFHAGAAAYAAGEYLAAIQAFEASYALTPFPAIAFSLAQAERRQYFVDHDTRHLARAIELFRRYLDQDPQGSRRGDAVEAISQLEPIMLLQADATEQKRTPEEARATRILVSTNTPARIAVDGGPSVPSPLIAEVTPGEHVISLEADGYHSVERSVIAVEGALVPVELALVEQPSTLLVQSDQDADFYLDGTLVGRNQNRLSLNRKAGRHRLIVSANGYAPHAVDVSLRRGRSTSVRVALRATKQRAVSRALFVAGGAGFVAGGVLGVLAWNSESDAREFLTKRREGNVSAKELTVYKEHVSERDAYRTAAFSSIGASALLVTTAWVLFELDEPRVEQYWEPARETPDAEPKNSAPLWEIGGAPDGAELGLGVKVTL